MLGVLRTCRRERKVKPAGDDEWLNKASRFNETESSSEQQKQQKERQKEAAMEARMAKMEAMEKSKPVVSKEDRGGKLLEKDTALVHAPERTLTA